MTDKKARKSKPLRIEGEMSIYRAAELRPLLLDPLAAGQSLDVDLSKVGEFDTSGVQLLLAAKRVATASGAVLNLKDPSARVCEVLELLNLSSHLDVAASGRA